MSPRAAWRLESLGFRNVSYYAPGKLDWISAGLPVEGTNAGTPNLGIVTRRDVPTCTGDERLSAVKMRMGSDPASPCVVINEHRIVMGLLRSDDLKKDDRLTVEEAMLLGPVTFRPNAGLEEADRYLGDHNLRYALVTTSDGELIGLADAGEIRRRMSPSGLTTGPAFD